MPGSSVAMRRLANWRWPATLSVRSYLIDQGVKARIVMAPQPPPTLAVMIRERMSSPLPYLIRMLLFLAAVAGLAFMLHEDLLRVFRTHRSSTA